MSISMEVISGINCSSLVASPICLSTIGAKLNFNHRSPNVQMMSWEYMQVRFKGVQLWRPRAHNCKHVNSKLTCNSDVACSHHSFLLPTWILHRRSSCLSCCFPFSWRLKKFGVTSCRMIHSSEKIRHHIALFVFRLMVGVMLFISLFLAVSNSPSFALSEENLLFLEAWRTIDRAYVDKTFNGQSWFRYRENALRNEPMNSREETYIAIKKMVATLNDPFTRFLEPERLRNLRSGTQSFLTGVGLSVGYPMELEGSSAGLVVVSAAPGGAASRAGISRGDIMLAIDDTSTEHMSIYEAADRLQGPEGSSVELTVCSGSEIKHVTLTRERVSLNPVKSRFCEVTGSGKNPVRVGYIKLTSFSKNASGAVKEAIETLRSNNVNAFILDLRDNGGGLFPEGVEIAKIWLDKGVIVYICDSRGVRDIYDTDGSSAIAASEPLAVLVNKGTASASEVLAGALKDNKRAVLFGEPTFGKGKIQSVFELSDGSGLAVTVARYETPAHKDINKVGVIPDHPLPESFPKDETEFCHCLQDPAAACYLTRVDLFPR
ncbi:Carboxyl-terminal-processing peptidase 2, chloroplastic [Dionaea muscipula]